MSLLNRYMHPRNIYRIPPDFKEMAILYPEFRVFTKQNIGGKVIIDFKDQATLRALTTTLLKKDFGLNVHIPLDRLVPTVPLRLNYLLWIEDLLSDFKGMVKEPIIGIDIGTGAASIYSLLAAKMNSWCMLATDVDVKNVEWATKNIDENQLQDLITVKQVEAGSLLHGVVDDAVTYDFCMCNPPFFSNEQELDAASKSRSAARPGPHNVRTGAIGEVVVEGGEVAFVQKMISESKELTTKIRIYTTMIGVKSSLAPLKSLLNELGISNVAQTEFCQGHTTRWGLAWTFENDLKLSTIVTKKKKRKRDKKIPSLKYVLPKPCGLSEYSVASATVKLVSLLHGIKMKCEEVKNDKHMTSHCISAYENTWSNQRQKRRRENKADDKTMLTLPDSMQLNGNKRLLVDTDDEGRNSKKHKLDVVVADGTTVVKQDSAATGSAPMLKAKLVVKKVSGEINIELSWVEGVCGKDSAHQVLQYLKNNLKD